MRRLGSLAVVLVATLVGLVLVELAVRALGLADHLVTDPAYVTHPAPGVGNRYKSHFQGTVQGPTSLRTNGFGARDREFEQAKPPGTLRIVVMGDSYAFGQGVAMEEAFPKVIERALAARLPGTRVEVINFGVQGYSLGQAVARFIADAAAFSPDIALLAPIADDLDPTRSQTFVDQHGYLSKVAGGDGQWKALLRRVHTAYLLKGIVYALLHRAQGQPAGATASEVLPASRAEVLESEVARFVEAARAAGAAPMFALVDFEQTATTDAIVRRVRARFPDLPVVDCPPQFAGRDPSTFVVPRDRHPNAEAHSVIARTILAPLIEMPPVRSATEARP